MSAAAAEVMTVGASGNALRSTVSAMDRTLHDLGQPLTSIALAVELVSREADKTTQEAMLLAARKECARAMRDVEELRRQTANLLHLADKCADNGGRAQL